jgi:DNA repair exonuclease SbcCD ATPase subunit
LIVDLKKEYADADAKIQDADRKIEAIGDVQAALSSIQKHNEAVKEKTEIEKSLAETVETGKATRAELNALGEAVNATLPFNDPLVKLQSEEDKVSEQLRPVIAAEERAKERARLTEQLGKLQKKAATLNELVGYFDKDGVKADLIKKHIGGFEDKMNSVLAAWGYKASLTMDPFSFEVTTKRGYSGPVKELSGAEEHIFKVAFQCAVSIAAGIGLVVIDEVEELGEDIRKNLYQCVFSLIQDGKLEQAIMIGFSLDKTLPKPQAPGSRYFYVTDGTVEELM